MSSLLSTLETEIESVLKEKMGSFSVSRGFVYTPDSIVVNVVSGNNNSQTQDSTDEIVNIIIQITFQNAKNISTLRNNIIDKMRNIYQWLYGDKLPTSKVRLIPDGWKDDTKPEDNDRGYCTFILSCFFIDRIVYDDIEAGDDYVELVSSEFQDPNETVIGNTEVSFDHDE